LKPSELTPACATWLIEQMLEAGFPPEVLNLVHGDGPETGNAIVEHPDVPVLSFTGSSEVGKIIAEKGGRMLKRVSLELGGKNAMIVLNDADLDSAVDGAIWGAFGTAGQRCTATSRIIVEESVHDKFVEKLVKAAKKLKLGYGNDLDVNMGPVVEEAAVEKTLRYIEIGKKEGAKLTAGGKRASKDGLDKGYFVEPTVFTDVKPTMRIAQEEIFGPVTAIIKVKNFEEAIKVCNGIEYGLSSSVYTQDVNKAFVAFRDIECGLTYINAPTIGAEAHMPFGGMKNTGNGHREGGWEPYHFYSETKACYVDYSGKLQRAQMDSAVD
jgi:aldehyde dehydrogenase (NAD+)